MRALVLIRASCRTRAAQLRTIPKEAVLGQLRHLQAMVVEIDGKPRSLAPGAQIRDPDNRLVLPVSLVEKTQVRYLVDSTAWCTASDPLGRRKGSAAAGALPEMKKLYLRTFGCQMNEYDSDRSPT